MCTMLSELLYPLQGGFTPLHYAARGGYTTFVEQILSTPGVDVEKIQSMNDEVIMICTCMVLNTHSIL